MGGFVQYPMGHLPGGASDQSRRVLQEVIEMANLLWTVAIAIVAIWLAVQIMRGEKI
jgi:hypothetical protein